MIWGQIDGAAEAVSGVLQHRSDSMVAAVVILIFVAAVLWMAFKGFQNIDQRAADREKEEHRRQQEREQEDQRRHDEQNKFNRDLALRNADQLDVVAEAMNRTSKATEIMAETTKQTEVTLTHLASVQQSDRRAIISMIDATDAKTQGREDEATDLVRRAREHLMRDDR